jgi:hypothetical protein
MTITDRGLLYSLDVLFSVLIVAIVLTITVAHVSVHTATSSDSFTYKQLETHALFLVDSLIKNNDANGMQGVAVYDEHKHRVKSHRVMETSIMRLENNPHITAAWVRDGNMVRTLFNHTTNKNCIGVERLVVMDGQKKVLGVRVCE